jgi:protein-S-isoprenylcysteine O-methyltransferase Ste14
MRTATSVVIWGCWAAWAVLWFAMAFSTKRTVEHPERSRVLVAVPVVAVLVLVLRAGHGLQGDALHRQLWAASPVLDAVAIALVVGGLAFTAWARVTLGSNWSGSVVFKEDHELIVTGPYALVRHPIYTGLLAMVLGSAVATAQAFYLGVFGAALVVFYLKSRREEALMSRHFPDAYPAYRRRVKALVPYVL